MRYDVDHPIKMCVMVSFPVLTAPLSLSLSKELKHENIVGLLDYQVGLDSLFLEPHEVYPVSSSYQTSVYSEDANTSVAL